jgi:Uma2 family endonuclease
MAQATATQSTLMTAEELLLLPGDVRCELVEGELVEMSPAGGEHGDVAHRITRHLDRLVDRGVAAQVVAWETGFILNTDPDTVRAPDVALIFSARLPDGRLPRGYIEGAPDLAVEVVSPGDRAAEIDAKVREYLSAGTRLVWVVYPETRCVHVFRADGTASVVREGGLLSGEDVLPGLGIALAEVFA